MSIESRLVALPRIKSAVTGGEVLRLVRRRRRWRRVGGVGVVLALLILGITIPRPAVRFRGDVPPPVLHALRDLPDRPLVLTDGDVVAVGEGVLLQVITAGPGTVVLFEQDGERIWPAEGEWRVGAGLHTMGDDRPMAWVADHPGPAALVAR